MKLINDPSCSLCNLNSPGTFIHMVWECPPVEQFWIKVASKLSDLTSVTVPATIPVLLLTDLSGLGLSRAVRRVVLAGITAAKKLVALRWKPPHSLVIRHWMLSFLDVVYLEMSTARINGAKESTLNDWRAVANSLKDLLQ